MEIKALLNKPYEEEARVEFIVEQNHNLGYEIRETETALEAWGKDENELFELVKVAKVAENTSKAKEAIENGYVTFKEVQFETNAQTVGDLTATLLMMQARGIETYTWLSKDDKVVELTVEDFATLGGIIAGYKNSVWNSKYIYYKEAIEQATTKEEVEKIVIDYTVNEEPENTNENRE